jgi:hypothetical protein
MGNGGAKVWYFPDGYLPEQVADSRLEPHEALMILNTKDRPAHLKLDFYFENRGPVKDIPVTVDAERSVCLRMDMPEHIGGVEIPSLSQYGLRVRSDLPVVCQFGRLDATQPNLAYYVNIGYYEDD